MHGVLAGRVAAVAMMVLGLALCVAQVDDRQGFIDMDEVAWVSSGRYLDVLVAGDFDNPDWWAFDRYAHHPPIGSYAVGVLLHAIGEPMTSMEPRRYWYEHDVDGFFDVEGTRAALNARVTQKQLMALRWASALLTWATAVMASLVARALAGWWAGVATMAILVLHPLFMLLGEVGQVDSLMTFAFTMGWAAALGLARSKTNPSTVAWSSLLAAAMTIAFGLKISGGFLVVPAALIVASAVSLRRAVVGFVCAVGVAVIATIALDPAMHHHPIDQTLARLDWRIDRISIQQLIFVEARLESLGIRIAWGSWKLFLGAPAAAALALACVLGVSRRASREQSSFIALALLSTAMAVASVPLSWERYIGVAVPSLAIVAGIGVARAIAAALDSEERRGLLVRLLIASALVLVAGLTLASAHQPPPPTALDKRIKGMMIHALHRPGEDRRLHELLLQYFESIGDERRARVEGDILARHPPASP